jgi:glutamate-ammonia-ligase adenylyltransferase
MALGSSRLFQAIDINHLPRPGDLEMDARNHERWLEATRTRDKSALSEFAEVLTHDPSGSALLHSIFGNSPFLSQCLIDEPDWLRTILMRGADSCFEMLLDDLAAESGDVEQTQLMRILRLAKRRAALLVAIADLAGVWSLEQICRALSRFAGAALSVASRHLLKRAHESGLIRLPHPETPELESGLVILGLGKLGAWELNYSSDIDLIVFFDEGKITYLGPRSVQECIVGLTRDLVRLISERTIEGYVFRTDLRLRPDPGSTPIALSTLAAETYYESFSQNWERAALIKARPVAGDLAAGADFLAFLRPIIWRKHLDFAAIRDIHSVKRQINAHKGGGRIAVAGHNIKLGRGGIREIEFFAQTQQLIWGGREPALRVAGTLDALNALAHAGHVDFETVAELTQCYRYLRTLEHRLQMVDDRQTQTLPDTPERLDAVAAFAGFADRTSFENETRRVLRTVERHYAQLFEHDKPLARHGNLVFTGAEDDPETLKTLTSMGFSSASAICERVRTWHHGRIRATRSERARELLTELLPALLEALARTAQPDEAFQRFDALLSALPAGIALFSLFHVNPGLLDLLADIMGDAPRLAEHLGRRPALLDALLGPGILAPPPGRATLARELDGVLAEAGGEFEAVLDATRRWANEMKFRAGIQTLRGLLTPAVGARHLSALAEIIVRALKPRVEAEFERLHGKFPGPGMVVVALGKLGSREMTASSDLDLITVYDSSPGAETSDGPKPLPPAVYYARLTQRLVGAISARTAEGVLYEVDLRLRPSGHSGPIATSLESFRLYHRSESWTWEHMALTRARVIAGSPELARAVRRAIRTTLTRERDSEQLRADIAEMRERIAREHKPASPWDIKYWRGGMIDIEFVAQFLQLRWARDFPAILDTATARVIGKAAGLGVLAGEDARILSAAHSLWTTMSQVLRHSVAGPFDPASAPGRLREVLVEAAGYPNFEVMKSAIEDLSAEALAIYNRLIAFPATSILAK